jgi:hypothetical protein
MECGWIAFPTGFRSLARQALATVVEAFLFACSALPLRFPVVVSERACPPRAGLRFTPSCGTILLSVIYARTAHSPAFLTLKVLRTLAV